MRAGLIKFFVLLLALSACKERQPRGVIVKDSLPAMFPDYSGVTIPPNIAH